MVADEVTRLTGRPVELVHVTTYGDTSREALAQIGGTGVFVSALREALLDGSVDFAVHSLKDLPTAQPADLALAAVPLREDPRDALVARDGLTLDELAQKCAHDGPPARVGTGSPRRAAQLNAYAAEHGLTLQTVPIRGNIDTRMGFVHSGELDAVVLAAAGLNRLGRLGEATQLLDTELMLPAPGQGALAVECRAGDTELLAALRRMDHAPTRLAVIAERALLSALEAGCSAPVGALAEAVPAARTEAAEAAPVAGAATETGPAGQGGTTDEGEPAALRLRALVGTTDGSTVVQLSATGALAPDTDSEQQAAALGRELAARMLAQGAAGLMGERAQ